MKSWKHLSLLLLACCLALKGCNRGGSEVENELSGGTIYQADGSPAVNARVRIYPVAYAPSESSLVQDPGAGVAYETRTNSQGRYAVDSLARGEYNVLGSLHGALSFEDSVYISGPRARLPDDTLGTPSTLTGYVSLQPNHDPRTATVQVLGTNLFANVDENGKFILNGLAEGRYSLRAMTTLPEYTATYGAATVEAGENAVLTDSLRLIYTGIPVVTLLSATYDTLQGIVTLRWKAVKFRNLEDYSVYRDPASSPVLSTSPRQNVKDTVYRDTLFGPGGLELPSLFDTEGFRYRVSVRNTSFRPGESHRSVIVQTPPPSTVRSDIQMRTAWAGDSASLGDTIRVVAFYRNPGRKLVKIKWSSDVDSTVREKSESSNSGNDGIDFTSKVVKRAWIRLAVTDEGGAVSRDSIRVSIVRDAPVADAGADTQVTLGDSVRFRGKGFDGFGEIVKWEWDIGATGKFSVGTRDTVVSPWEGSSGSVTGILRVTDDDGEIGLDTTRIEIVSWRFKARRPGITGVPLSSWVSADTVDGRIYVHESGLTPNFSEYDPSTNGWRNRPEFDWPGVIYSLLGRIYSFFGSAQLHEFDLRAGIALLKQQMQTPRSSRAVYGIGNSIFVFGGDQCCIGTNTVESYDPAKNEWRFRPSIPFANAGATVDFTSFTDGSSVFILPVNGSPDNYRFDPSSDTWHISNRLSYGDVLDPVGLLDGKYYFLSMGAVAMHSYDPRTDLWEKGGNLTTHSFNRGMNTESCLVNNGRFTCFFQAKPTEIHAFEYAPDTKEWKFKSMIRTNANKFKVFLIRGKAYILSFVKTENSSTAANPEIYEYLLAP